MIGDLLILLKEWFKEQSCLHIYKGVYRKDNGGSFEQCIKCNRIK